MNNFEQSSVFEEILSLECETKQAGTHSKIVQTFYCQPFELCNSVIYTHKFNLLYPLSHEILQAEKILSAEVLKF